MMKFVFWTLLEILAKGTCLVSILPIHVYLQSRGAPIPQIPLVPGEGERSVWEEAGGKYEGDMILDRDQMAEALGFELRNGLKHSRYRWPKKTLPYQIVERHFDSDQIEQIHEALSEFAKVSCVTVRPRIKGESNYIRITGRRNGCYAMVGYQRGGAQTVNLAPHAAGTGCMQTAVIQHEVLHALGFYHMQSATDRDKYVTIMWDNIRPGSEHNFNRYKSRVITSHGVSYDYASIMHYGPYAFSKNGKKTIVPKDPSANIGQRERMSDRDIKKLKKMYSCPK